MRFSQGLVKEIYLGWLARWYRTGTADPLGPYLEQTAAESPCELRSARVSTLCLTSEQPIHISEKQTRGRSGDGRFRVNVSTCLPTYIPHARIHDFLIRLVSLWGFLAWIK